MKRKTRPYFRKKLTFFKCTVSTGQKRHVAVLGVTSMKMAAAEIKNAFFLNIKNRFSFPMIFIVST